MITFTTRIVLVGLVVPLIVAIGAAILMLSWLPTLPDVVAVHWSGTGADGFGPVWVPILLPLVITGLFVTFSVRSSLVQARDGRIGMNQKFLLVVGVWLSAMLAIVLAGSLAIQRTADGAALNDSGRSILPILGIGAAVGIVLAVLAWFALPRADNGSAPLDDAVPFVVSSTERLTWTRTARLSTGLIVGIALILAAAIVAVAITIASTRGGGAIIVVGIVLVVAVVLLSSTGLWRVTADSRGLIVRSWLGWPRVRVAAGDIRSVRVVTVGAGGEFGGYGIRWGFGGRLGIILRPGPALEVTRASGRTVLVTVDDAHTGASVLATYQKQDA